jgi:hypothetical protein
MTSCQPAWMVSYSIRGRAAPGRDATRCGERAGQGDGDEVLRAYARHADTTCGASHRRTCHIWCCMQLVPRAIQVRGGNREPGANPGLPRSGERERQPSGPCAQARGSSSTGPFRPGKRRPVGGASDGAVPVSPKTCQRAARGKSARQAQAARDGRRASHPAAMTARCCLVACRAGQGRTWSELARREP